MGRLKSSTSSASRSDSPMISWSAPAGQGAAPISVGINLLWSRRHEGHKHRAFLCDTRRSNGPKKWPRDARKTAQTILPRRPRAARLGLGQITLCRYPAQCWAEPLTRGRYNCQKGRDPPVASSTAIRSPHAARASRVHPSQIGSTLGDETSCAHNERALTPQEVEPGVGGSDVQAG